MIQAEPDVKSQAFCSVSRIWKPVANAQIGPKDFFEKASCNSWPAGPILGSPVRLIYRIRFRTGFLCTRMSGDWERHFTNWETGLILSPTISGSKISSTRPKTKQGLSYGG